MGVSLEEGYNREAHSRANRPAFKSQGRKDKGALKGLGVYFDKISNKASSSKWEGRALS